MILLEQDMASVRDSYVGMMNLIPTFQQMGPAQRQSIVNAMAEANASMVEMMLILQNLEESLRDDRS